MLEATLPPGVKEQVHSHPAYLIYVLEAGDVLYREPLTHAAENIGDKALHMILVELKGEAGKSGRP